MFESTDALLKQITLGEDSVLELKDLRYKGEKVISPHRESIADELAAMANTATGVLVFGVDDKSKTITGIPAEKLDLVEMWIRNICHDLITPNLFCKIRKCALTLDGKEHIIIRVDVPKSLYIHQSSGGYLYRIGSSKRQMPPDYLARLFQERSLARLQGFDEQPVPQARADCLNKDLWQKFQSPLSTDDDETFLQKLKLLTQTETGQICPSVSGILMATAHPEHFLPNAYIQAVAYRGTERNANYQTEARDITGTLDNQIAQACQFVWRNMKIFAQKTPAREDRPQYAMQAIFEAVVNAVAHRDYSIYGSKIRLHLFSDRLEIFSPGNIPNTMTVDSLALRQFQRNQTIVSLLARCPMPEKSQFEMPRSFLMDKRGEGVPIIYTESKKCSGKQPAYQLIDESELLLTIFAYLPSDWNNT